MVCQFYWCVYHVSVLLVCYCIFVKEISFGAALTIDFVNGVCSTDALTIDSFFLSTLIINSVFFKGGSPTVTFGERCQWDWCVLNAQCIHLRIVIFIIIILVN
jgi:hypothetical protein